METGDKFDLICPSEYMIMKLAAEDKLEELPDSFYDTSVETNYYAKNVSPFIKDTFDSNEINGKAWSKYAAGYMWGTTGFVFNPELVDENDVKTWNVFTNQKYNKKITAKDNVRDSYFAGLGMYYENDIKALKTKLDNGEIDLTEYQKQLSELMNDTSETTMTAVQELLIQMKKNILVVDDSALMRRVICDIINSDETFQAIDTCRDGLDALEKLRAKRYDGVVLDVNMPRMDGLALLEQLQKERIRATVIMVSTTTTKDAEVTMLAMERGAVDFVPKPTNVIEAKGEAFKGKLLGVLNAVLKTQKMALGSKSAETPEKVVLRRNTEPVRSRNKLVALACSTGGPKALQSVIPYLPKNLDAPMVLVQHMPAGFTKSMADRLNEVSDIHVKEAEDGDVLKKGTIYIAPGGKHMEIKKSPDGSHKIRLNDELPPIGGLKPCADITYDSLRTCGYDQIVCVVLTGMGADGTKGIKSLAKSKPVYVISQNAETCVVYGMPKSIAETGLVNEVVPLTQVAQTITKNVGVQ